MVSSRVGVEICTFKGFARYSRLCAAISSHENYKKTQTEQRNRLRVVSATATCRLQLRGCASSPNLDPLVLGDWVPADLACGYPTSRTQVQGCEYGDFAPSRIVKRKEQTLLVT